MFYLLFFIAFAFAVASDIYDVRLTERGLAKGVALEANDWLVGDKPSARALYLRDLIIISAVSLLAPLAHVYGARGADYGFIICPVVAGIRHILGGRKWAALLK